ncbi:MAG: cytochrome c family protein [Parasphingorhabdus sp.]
MTKIKALAGAIALSALVAGCSGGGSSETAEEAPAIEEATGGTAEEAPAEETATNDNPMATKDGVDYANLTGDAAKGKIVFAQCRTCHVTDPDVNRTGPSLAGIIGRTAGSVKGFKYSTANADSGLTWTEEQMYVYLENPQRTIPKTKMIYAGLPKAQDRADIIAYLKNPI